MVAHGMQQSQSLALQQILAPQLQQSLLILQTPLLELRNLVQQEMETNPVLEELSSELSPEERNGAEASAEDHFKEEFEKLATQETLQQNLIGQLNQAPLNAADRKAAELIIGNIDDNGFLQGTSEEMTLNT